MCPQYRRENTLLRVAADRCFRPQDPVRAWSHFSMQTFMDRHGCEQDLTVISIESVYAVSEQNPFIGQTTVIPRPTGTEPKYRYQTVVTLDRDQRLWEAAAANRWENRRPAEEVGRVELATRARLEYMSTPLATATEWERSKVQIIADFLEQETERPRPPRSAVRPAQAGHIR